MLRVIARAIKQDLFSKRWRKLNSHNQTIAVNRFDMQKVKVGNMSYGPLEVFGWGAINESLTIGNYVSIASDVRFLLGGNHFYNNFSTYPFKVKLGLSQNEAYSNGPIIVEDDVWIGIGVMILSGVTIGKGSVIAAGSIVTKDVLPYSVVGGNPAKTIKMRFNDLLINQLLQFDFSSLDHNIIKQEIDLFYNDLDHQSYQEIVALTSRKMNE